MSASPGADVSVDLLPHRPPFLFVDEVVSCEPGVSATALYHVTGDEPFLAGHFPGNPIFPGVLQLEALAQTGALIVLASPERAGSLPLFGGVERTRFRRIVEPGDTLRLEVEMERIGGSGGWGRGKARVGDAVACEARILFVFNSSGDA